MTGTAEAVPAFFIETSQKVPSLVKIGGGMCGILWADQKTDLISSRGGRSGPTVRQPAQNTGHIWCSIQLPKPLGARYAPHCRPRASLRRGRPKTPVCGRFIISHTSLLFLSKPPARPGALMVLKYRPAAGGPIAVFMGRSSPPSPERDGSNRCPGWCPNRPPGSAPQPPSRPPPTDRAPPRPSG